MIELHKLIVSIIILLALTPFVGWLIDKAAKLDNRSYPEIISKDEWDEIIKRPSGGVLVGIIERLIFLAAFWNEGYMLIIPAWLAFKVAAKWESWKNIIQVPHALNTQEEDKEPLKRLQYLKVRNDWGTYLLTRFMVGTGSNLLISLLATYVGKNICLVCKYIR